MTRTLVSREEQWPFERLFPFENLSRRFADITLRLSSDREKERKREREGIMEDCTVTEAPRFLLCSEVSAD